MRTALVTGASRGIGLGIARSLATQGYGLTITSRAEADLKGVANDLRELGAPVVVHRAVDLAVRDDLPGLVNVHEQAFGSMNALVVNAGVGTAGQVASYRLDRLDKTVEVNFSSALVLIKAALPLLRAAADVDERGHGRLPGG